MIFWQLHYPDYFGEGTRVLNQEEVDEEMNFYYPRQRNYIKRDIIYQGINVDFVLAMFGGTKIKKTGQKIFIPMFIFGNSTMQFCLVPEQLVIIYLPDITQRWILF